MTNSPSTDATPRLTNFRIAFEPYPHLRDDNGCVLANDYVSDRAHAVVEAVNAYERLTAENAELRRERDEARGQRDELARKLSHLVDELKSAEARADALRKVLVEIESKCDGDRASVNDANIWHHFKKLNRTIVQIRELSRAALAKMEAGK